jgi:hypothetical protein
VPDRSRQLWLLPVLLITVIATAVGGLLARNVYDEEPAAAEPPAVIPSETSVAPSEQPGPPNVKGTPDATQHPLYQSVRDLLQVYFDSINDKDYAAWQGTVTPERIARQPEEKWRADYRSTRDGSPVIYRIEVAGDDTATVLLTFVSVQDEADAPKELPSECIRWNVVFPLALQPEGWKIDSSSASASPQYERCT